MIWTSIQLAFAGAWSMIWHWGTGVALIVLCLAGAYFTTAIPIIGPYLSNARKDLLWAAAVIAIFMAGQWVGAADESKRGVAKTVVIERTVDRVVEKATAPGAKKTKDPWDREDY